MASRLTDLTTRGNSLFLIIFSREVRKPRYYIPLMISSRGELARLRMLIITARRVVSDVETFEGS